MWVCLDITNSNRNFPRFNVEFAQPLKEQTNATESFYRGPDYWDDRLHV